MTRLRRVPMLPWIVALGVLVMAGALVRAAVRGDDETPSRPAERAAIDRPPAPPALLSRPDLRPPPVAVDTAPARPGKELMFVSPRLEDRRRDGRTHQQGALALDGTGRAVWFRPAPDGEPITEVRVQRYRGKPVLTWWQGAASKYGIGRGEGVIVDESYRTLGTVQAGNGLTSDLHEFLLTPRGTALLTIYARARRDLTALGGRKDAQVTEGIVQEVDVESGRVLFEWHSLDNVDPSESERPLPEKRGQSFDYFHINSVEQDGDGNFLVSARHTSAIYKIDGRTGKVLWRLGGKKSDFTMGPGAEFGIQHDARWRGDLVQLFDNGAEDERGAQAPSSVKVLRLDHRRRRAELVRRFSQPDGLWAESQGNGQQLPGGGVMVGWGSAGAFSHFDGGGRLLFDAHLPAEYDSYRVHRAAWTGRPARPPAIHVRREGEQVTVRASWNGATQVRGWQVLAGSRPESLRPIGAVARWSGLETTIVRSTPDPYTAVAAVDAAGRTLQASAVRRIPPPKQP